MQANPKVEKFRKEGIDKELEGKLIGYSWTSQLLAIKLGHLLLE